MRILPFLPLAMESNWANYKHLQTLSQMLLWTAVLALALVAGTHDLPKAVVKLEPPWIQVLKEDNVTLKCEGAHDLGNYSYSTQWFHNGSRISGQDQSSYRFKVTMNDSGEYQCQMDQTSLSGPVYLGVTSDWLLLQTSQLVFQEGETFTLKCHSWKSQALNKITFFQNGNPMRFSNNNSWLISKANHTHSGDYYCKAFLGKNLHTSKSVTLTVRGPKPSNSSLTLTVVAAVTGIAVAVIVIILIVLAYRKQKQAPALPGNPEHREMGETLPMEIGEYSMPSGGSVTLIPGPPCGLEPASISSSNPIDDEEAAKTEAENTITYSLLKHPEAVDEDTEPDYQNHL
ncbi:low affinity immunoglobulin gamma Fc region receptor II-b isoform X2 [Nannospalax galili]|uniref:Ig-like domain-containing protein n=1 Tax=Nannospalax galili TaxID=1026970 RepID=A0A8C6QSP8_NANGA|nr:low affinity immunoglobulin gamma Fc region receptor II-b isoform X2 [Nannospalax galili]